MSTNKTEVVKNLKEKSLLVSREFNAPIADVWQAFTDSKLLDQWWAPAPWKAETKHMDFTPGGYWLYAMIGPGNEKHWGRMNYKAINELKSYELEDAFCDENGKINTELPVSTGSNNFTETENGTRVEFKTTYPTEADLQKVIEMGMEEGIKICFEQLEKLLSAKRGMEA